MFQSRNLLVIFVVLMLHTELILQYQSVSVYSSGNGVLDFVLFTLQDLGGRVSEIVNYSMSITDDDGRNVRYIVVERSVTFTLSNRDSFTVSFIFVDEIGNNMTRSVRYGV